MLDILLIFTLIHKKMQVLQQKMCKQYNRKIVNIALDWTLSFISSKINHLFHFQVFLQKFDKCYHLNIDIRNVKNDIYSCTSYGLHIDILSSLT